MATLTSTVEALGLLGPGVWTPLYPGFLYDPASFRSQVEGGFVYDPVSRSGTTGDGFLYDEHGFRVEATEQAVADDIAGFCARVGVLQGEADALSSRRGGGLGGVADAEVAGDDDDALADGFSHIIDFAEELLLEDDEDDGACYFSMN
uniref:Uncharacterized protein n=1 Tax=Leersia perrieri TaxID=77586 RepID=A0A0D9W715_9ORYZ